MTGYDSHVIIRVGKGSDDPLDPGVQHKAGDYTKERVQKYVDDDEIINFMTRLIFMKLIKKYNDKKPIILVEYPEKYND